MTIYDQVLMLKLEDAYRRQHKAVQEEISTKEGGTTPEQYGLPEGATELQDLIEYRDMNFSIGNIFKACYRLGNCKHSSPLRDLRKIQWFIDREIQRYETQESVEKDQDNEALPSVQENQKSDILPPGC